jgi:hypothetical protein
MSLATFRHPPRLRICHPKLLRPRDRVRVGELIVVRYLIFESECADMPSLIVLMQSLARKTRVYGQLLPDS